MLQTSNLIYLFFNLGCGLAQTKNQLIAFRFLAGLGGSAPLALGGGVLSDLFTADDRGKAISIYSLAPLLGPAIGPIAGGFIAENTTWRWVFYATTIADAVIQIIGLFFLQETFPPVLLERKKNKLLKETGNQDLHTEWDVPDRSLAKTLTISLTRPFKLLGMLDHLIKFCSIQRLLCPSYRLRGIDPKISSQVKYIIKMMIT